MAENLAIMRLHERMEVLIEQLIAAVTEEDPEYGQELQALTREARSDVAELLRSFYWCH